MSGCATARSPGAVNTLTEPAAFAAGSQPAHAMNRLRGFLEELPEEEFGDFYVVAGEFGAACVTRETARRVVEVLNRWWVPTWIEFEDRVGSSLRVRTRMIRSIGESTTAQRAADRRLERAREREEKSDRRPWEDEN